MKTILYGCLLAAVLTTFAGKVSAEPFRADFSGDPASELFDPAAKNLSTLEAIPGGVLLPAKIGEIATRSFPVEGAKKYRLEIVAGVDGDFVVEKNRRAAILTLQSHLYRLTGAYRLHFQDAEGQGVGDFGGRPAAGFFLTSVQTPYTTIFYAPQQATSVKIAFKSNGRAVRITGFLLEEETQEGTVNPNPDFRYGELSYSGWKPQRDGRLYKRPDGKVVLNIGYAGQTPLFPVQQGRKYHVSAVGSGGTASISYYKQDGARISSRAAFKVKEEGATMDFIPPEGVGLVGFSFLPGAILESFSVTEIQ